MIKITYKLIAITAFIFSSLAVSSQSLSTGFPLLEDYYRRAQLTGEIGLDHSFVSYPLFPKAAFGTEDIFDPMNGFKVQGSRFKVQGLKFDGKFMFKNGKSFIQILPFIWKNQYNSHHPEEFNDGIMIPAKGYQTYLSTGFYYESEHLQIKIQPEFVHASNPEYEGFPLTRENPELAILRWAQYYGHTLNYIDMPERFGDSTYSKMSWGQSSIRLTFNDLSVGFSTENLWWGPGMRNSLLMSNTAPGFAHFTLNSVKPIKTWIGSFEGQIIAGWLKNSGYKPPNTTVVDYNGRGFWTPKPNDNRYINAGILSYQPKWVPGLFIGLMRSFQIYLKELGSEVIDYFPIFSALGRKSAQNENGQLKKYDAYNSIFLRFVWPESQVEIYGEYGRADYYYDKTDLILQAEHSNAYVIGFRKLIPLSKRDAYIQVFGEITQLAKNATTILRNGRSWYASPFVRHGYTHNGQMIGAGIGPGGNLQTLNISWIKGLKQIGLQFERLVHNQDFFFEQIKDIRMHWVDLSMALNVNWDYKNLLFFAKFKFVKAFNYQWVFDYNVDDYWDASGARDVFNFHSNLGVIYRF